MTINIQIKQLGKRKPTLLPQEIEIPNLKSGVSLETFIKHIVAQQVAAFNARKNQPELVQFLLSEDLKTLASQGKVSFGDSYNASTISLQKAQDNALLAFKDGLFKVFQDDTEIETLDTKMAFDSKSVFTFIRLTFLAGSSYY